MKQVTKDKPRASHQARRPASPLKRRAQLRRFLQRLIDGPIINASRITNDKDLQAAFVKLGGAR
jgi:hypothetical protein